MVVKIRFGRGSVVTRRKGKNARIALLAGSLLTLIAICLAFMGFWRLFGDVDIAGDFVFSSGILSHWQVWLGSAAGIQYGAWRLARYARGGKREDVEPEDQETASDQPSSNNPAALRP